MGLLARFPGLRRLALTGGKPQRNIRFIQQPAATDCGAASLAMCLGLHGREVTLEEMRALLKVDRGGTDAISLVQGARAQKLRARPQRIDDLANLANLPRGSILHWEFNHWVVFDSVQKGGVVIFDPALGKRLIPTAKMGRSFTGIAISLEPTDEFEPQAAAKRGVLTFLRKIIRDTNLLSRIITTSLLIQVFGLIIPLITGMLVDTVVPRQDMNLLFVLAIGATMLVLFHFAASFLRAHLLLAFQTKLDTRMTLEFLEHLVDLPYGFFQRRTAGDLMMRLNSNTEIREILMGGFISGVLDGFLVFIYLLLILFTSVKLGLIVVGLGAIRITLYLFTRKRLKDLAAATLTESTAAQSYQVQLLNGIETLKASGAEHRAVSHWTNLFVNLANVNLDRGRLDAVLHSVGGALYIGAPVIILIAGGAMVLSGDLSLGMMLAINALAMGFLTPLGNLVETAFKFQQLGSYFDRINDVFDTPREQDAGDVQPAPQLRGGITLERVVFRYGASEPVVVKDVSLDINRGEFVALVGASGSGKSTLAKIMLGLYLPSSGRVLYDGHDLGNLELRSVRRQLGVVPQTPFVFGSSIRENIAMVDPTTEMSEIVRAAKMSQIHDEIMAMPMAYDTMLADGGASMSGGQRQRLVMARALVQRPAVLLLDEATSALDAITEKRLQLALAELRCTRIVIAHRLSTIMDADRIVVMDKGELVEQGSHEDLMMLNGKYSELVRAQMESDDEWRDGTQLNKAPNL
ncbi:MAG: peptidase domain-containing ABC transporter [Myxococcales bacterium]|nr:peptidase domain-containing ABC transporter [Myxococcales bacterium]